MLGPDGRAANGDEPTGQVSENPVRANLLRESLRGIPCGQ